MAYFDDDTQPVTPEAEAESRRRMLGMLASTGKTSVLGNRDQPMQPGSRGYDLAVGATAQPRTPSPRSVSTDPPNMGQPSFGAPPFLASSTPPVRPNTMPQRSDYPASPELHGWKKVLGLGLATLAGPQNAGQAAEGILHGQRDKANQLYQQDTQDWERGQGDAARQAQIRNIDSEIQARTNKPDPADRGEAKTVTVGDKVMQWNPDTKRYDIEVGQGKAPRENKAVAGTSGGKPSWGVQTEKGWVNPQTQQPIPDFQPPPSFAETGLYEPVEVPQAGGGMAPGVFNKRTGTTTPMSPQRAPIPKEAQKAIDESLTTARGMDRLERAQGQILQGVEKRGQAGPLGGGPYLNGPESMQFVANHIAMTFGSVKGARIGRDIIEQHVKARDLDQSTEAMAQRVLSGGVITYTQAQQMAGTAKINRQQAWKQAQDAATQYGVPDAVKMPGDFTQGGTHNFTFNGQQYENVPDALYNKYKGKPGFKE